MFDMHISTKYICGILLYVTSSVIVLVGKCECIYSSKMSPKGMPAVANIVSVNTL